MYKESVCEREIKGGRTHAQRDKDTETETKRDEVWKKSINDLGFTKLRFGFSISQLNPFPIVDSRQSSYVCTK